MFQRTLLFHYRKHHSTDYRMYGHCRHIFILLFIYCILNFLKINTVIKLILLNQINQYCTAMHQPKVTCTKNKHHNGQTNQHFQPQIHRHGSISVPEFLNLCQSGNTDEQELHQIQSLLSNTAK